LLVGQSFLGVEDWREASFKVDHAVTAQVLDLFKGDSFQRFFRLHDRDGVGEALEILAETALVRALMEPLGKGLRIVGGKLQIFRTVCQFDHGFRSQHAIQVFVQKYLWQLSQQRFIELHGMFGSLIKGFSEEHDHYKCALFLAMERQPLQFNISSQP
jgi:hypothetical protein